MIYFIELDWFLSTQRAVHNFMKFKTSHHSEMSNWKGSGGLWSVETDSRPLELGAVPFNRAGGWLTYLSVKSGRRFNEGTSAVQGDHSGCTPWLG